MNKILRNFLKIVDKEYGIVNKIIEVPFESGMPPIYTAIAFKNNITDINKNTINKEMNVCHANSFNKYSAITSCIGEAIERYCCTYLKKDLILGSYNELVNKFNRILKPDEFCTYGLDDINNKKIRWVEGKDLFNDEVVLIPASLIFMPYPYCEEVLREQITTGIACGENLQMALYGAICENVERDSFMISWLSGLNIPAIDIENINDKAINDVVKFINSFGFRITLRRFLSDIEIPSYVAIAKSDNPKLPIRYISLNAGFDTRHTIMKLIADTVSGYIGISKMINSNCRIPNSLEEIESIIDHALYYGKNLEPDLMYLLEEDKTLQHLLNTDEILTNINEKLDMAKRALKHSNIDAYYVDVTTNDVEEIGLKVVRVISPDLCYLQSRSPDLRCERIFSVSEKFGKKIDMHKLNLSNHPFA